MAVIYLHLAKTAYNEAHAILRAATTPLGTLTENQGLNRRSFVDRALAGVRHVQGNHFHRHIHFWSNLRFDAAL